MSDSSPIDLAVNESSNLSEEVPSKIIPDVETPKQVVVGGMDETDDTGMNESWKHFDTVKEKDQHDHVGKGGEGAASLSAPGDVENPDTNGTSNGDSNNGAAAPKQTKGLDGRAPERHVEETAGLQRPKTPKPRRQMNPDFQDLQQTGKWGKLSKIELLVALLVAVLAIVAAIVVAVVIHDKNKNSGTTSAPTATFDPTVHLSEVLRIIGDNNFTSASLQLLPNNTDFYKGKATNASQAHYIRAMSWLLFQDTRSELQGIQFRYALAALYYAWAGPNWTNTTNWLTSEVACQWHGVNCNLASGSIKELDLADNHLVGTIPNEVALLTDLASLQLNKNELSGTLAGDLVGSLPVLSILNLASNKFTGTVPDNLARNGVLQSLYIQFNNFTGDFPDTYCDLRTGTPLLNSFTFDCLKVYCRFADKGCCSSENCFY